MLVSIGLANLKKRKEPNSPALKPFLDLLEARYHRAEYLFSDPLEFVHRYRDPWDQEVVAVLAALLAYGNVKQIRRSVEAALTRMRERAPTPAAFVRSLGTAEGAAAGRHALSSFVHRFNTGDDVWVLFRLLERSWTRHGSLGAHFLEGLQESDADIGGALGLLIGTWRGWAQGDFGQAAGSSFYYFLTSPLDGSCCKRWCMLLRWMGRRDPAASEATASPAALGLDPGLWARGSPLAATFPAGKALHARQLVLPLDTHTGRISQYLGLTRRKSLNWLAALEVTAALRACDPDDPTRYDFAMARLGILQLCQKKFRPEICGQCQLVTVCRFSHRRFRAGPGARAGVAT